MSRAAQCMVLGKGIARTTSGSMVLSTVRAASPRSVLRGRQVFPFFSFLNFQPADRDAGLFRKFFGRHRRSAVAIKSNPCRRPHQEGRPTALAFRLRPKFQRPAAAVCHRFSSCRAQSARRSSWPTSMAENVFQCGRDVACRDLLPSLSQPVGVFISTSVFAFCGMR